MNFLKLLKKYCIDSQIYVSLVGTLLATFFMLEEYTFRFPTFFLIFITYFSGYIYTKYQNHKIFPKILFINIISGIICAILIIVNHHQNRLFKWLLIVVLGLFYNSKFLDTYIRKIPLLKVFYVGLIWGLVNSWLSFPNFNFPIFIISFLFITALVLPFDIRDMKEDNIITFPKLIGVQNTKYLAYFLTFLATIFAIYSLKPEYKMAFYATFIISLLLIYFSEMHRKDSYFSFWVETCSALPFVILILIKQVI